MKKAVFSEFRLVFREKPSESIESGRKKDTAEYSFSEEEIDKQYDRARGYIDKLGSDKEIKIVLRGIAGKTPFDVIKQREGFAVDLNKSKEWRRDMETAMKELRGKKLLQRFLPEAKTETYELFEAALDTNGLEAIWILPLQLQQKLLKYITAYLVAKSMQDGLSKRMGENRRNVKFRIETQWDTKTDGKTRVGMQLEYRTKKTAQPALRRETIAGIEYGKTQEWNERILPTFDDGPVVKADGSVDNVTLDLMRSSYERGVNKMEFYWIGSNLLSKAARKQMGIKVKSDVPVATDKVRPGHWKEWIYKNKPAGMDTQKFIKTLVNPEIIQMCQDILKIKYPNQPLADLIGFHGMTHEGTGGGRHLTDLTKTELEDEIWFFEELIRAAFNDPNYTVKKARTPYGTGLEFDTDNPAKKYEEKGRKMRAATPRISWNAWYADTNDWKNNGDFNVEKVTDEATEGEAKKTDGRKRILMHERYYADTEEPVKDMYSTLAYKHSREYLEQKKKVDLRLELGKWTVEKINEMLRKAQQIKDPNERICYIIEQFKPNAGFVYDSQLPILEKGKLRIRLSDFDCITFIYYMLAMNQARDFNEFADNYKKLRYKNPEELGVDNDPENGNIYDFTYESLYENAAERGFVSNVTKEAANGHLTTVSTTLKPVIRDSTHDKKKQLVSPKVHNGEKVSAQVISVDDYKKMDKSKVRTGDIITFTGGGNKKVIFTHNAFAIVKNGEIYMTHASKYCPKPGICSMESEDYRLDNYMRRIGFAGFAILRPHI